MRHPVAKSLALYDTVSQTLVFGLEIRPARMPIVGFLLCKNEDMSTTHRQIQITALIDAAEEIMFAEGEQTITASAVARRAGMARNSIYRYVNSIDELPAHVLARHLPAWLRAVESELEKYAHPRERILAYIAVNLRQCGRSGHGKLMAIARNLSPEALAQVKGAHELLAAMLRRECSALDPSGADLTAAFIQAVLEAGMDQIAGGEDVERVVRRAAAAVGAIIDQRSHTRTGKCG